MLQSDVKYCRFWKTVITALELKICSERRNNTANLHLNVNVASKMKMSKALLNV